MALLAINGKSGSGKDTVGEIIRQQLGCDWKIRKFGMKVKEICSSLTGIPLELFEDQDFKKTYLGSEWDYWTVCTYYNNKFLFEEGKFNTEAAAILEAMEMELEFGGHLYEHSAEHKQMTVRQLLQEVGTDAMRDVVHQRVWINALMSEYKLGPFYPEVSAEAHSRLPKWIITDLRFPNEYETLKKLGVVTIRIERPGAGINPHPSETALDSGYKFDYTIVNDGTLEQLQYKVGVILADIKSYRDL